MGLISGFADAVVVLFSAVLSVVVPLFDAQSCLPKSLYPAQLLELNKWYAEQFGDYLVAEKPHFFVGLTWVEIVFLWPLSIANVYGILARRPWAATTSLMAGVIAGTSLAAILADFQGSGRASEKLLQMYFPFIIFSILAILRGLFSRPRRASSASGSHGPSARKKRV